MHENMIYNLELQVKQTITSLQNHKVSNMFILYKLFLRR